MARHPFYSIMCALYMVLMYSICTCCRLGTFLSVPYDDEKFFQYHMSKNEANSSGVPKYDNATEEYLHVKISRSTVLVYIYLYLFLWLLL